MGEVLPASRGLAKAVGCSLHTSGKALLLKTTLMALNTKKPSWCLTRNLTPNDYCLWYLILPRYKP